MSARTCNAKGCPNRHHAKGWCNKHHMRMKRTGQVDEARPWISDLEERMEFYTERNSVTGCLEWTGALLTNGYGYMSKTLSGTNAPHRHAWAVANGPIPEGAWIDHACHNRRCVEPKHLRLANAVENGTNRAGANKNSSTGVRGVHRYKNGFRVRMSLEGKWYDGGLFSTIPEAARVAEQMRSRLYGAYAGRG